VKPIVARYLERSAGGFATAEIGFRLNPDDSGDAGC
jgi:hypothetical protein